VAARTPCAPPGQTPGWAPLHLQSLSDQTAHPPPRPWTRLCGGAARVSGAPAEHARSPPATTQALASVLGPAPRVVGVCRLRTRYLPAFSARATTPSHSAGSVLLALLTSQNSPACVVHGGLLR